jgi:pyrroloquinoline quinone biosynthesis protein E
MPLPCRECDFREIDFGGCRCQAALIAGDASVTDPACALSPYREKLTAFVESCQAAKRTSERESWEQSVTFRTNPGD